MNELYNIKGKQKPFLDWCREYNASPVQMRALVSLGVSLESALQSNKDSRIILFAMNGRINTLAEWCRMYNVDPSTFKKRVKSGYNLREALEARKYSIQRLRDVGKVQREYTISKPFLEWCKDYDANPLQIRAAMSRGYSLEYALRYAPKDGNDRHLVMHMEGKTGSFSEFCSLYRKAPHITRKRVHDGMILEDSFLLPALKSNGVKMLRQTGHANEVYSISQTLPDWCEDYHTSLVVVQLRMKLGTPLRRALHTPSLEEFKRNSREISVTELCRHLGADAETVLGHMAQGMNLFEALAMPPLNRVR